MTAVALVAGNTAALWVMLMVPDAGPTAVGVNTTEITQLPPGGMDALALNTQGGSTAIVTAGLTEFSAALLSFVVSAVAPTAPSASVASLNCVLSNVTLKKLNKPVPLLVAVNFIT